MIKKFCLFYWDVDPLMEYLDVEEKDMGSIHIVNLTDRRMTKLSLTKGTFPNWSREMSCNWTTAKQIREANGGQTAVVLDEWEELVKPC